MRELCELIINTYNDYRGTGKLLALFLVSVLIIRFTSGQDEDGDHRCGRPGAAVFVLAPLAGIAYAFTLLCRELNKRVSVLYKAAGMLFILIALMCSGRLIFPVNAEAVSGTGFPGIILHVIMIIICGLAYVLLASRLFEDKGSRVFMLLLVCVLNIFSYQSEPMLKYTLLYAGSGIGALVVHGLLPFVLWILLGMKDKIGDFSDADQWEEEDMKNHRILNARTLAVALLIVVIMLIGSVYIMNRKINSLYNTTVELQRQVEELKQDSGK